MPSSSIRGRKMRASYGILGHAEEEGSTDSAWYVEDDYRQLCAETVKAIGDSLLKPSYQPENIDLIEIMQEVGQSLGCTVEYSRGRILVATAGVAHQLAESKLKSRLDDDEDWMIVTGIHVALSCGTRRQPDISGWREPVRLDSTASQVTQRPDWVCEILSAKTKKQDLPNGDKFLEYAASGIPHYWIVDPTTGQITVFELRVDEYIPIQKASLNENRKCQLSPFGMELDLTKVFFYLL